MTESIAAVATATSTATTSGAAKELYYCVGATKAASTFVVTSFRSTVVKAYVTKAATKVIAADSFVIFPFLSTPVSF